MDEIDDRQQQAEAAAAAAAAAEGRRQRVEVIIEKHDEYDWRTRNKIDELVDAFLTRTKDDSTAMLHISVYDRHQRAEAAAADPQQWQVECRSQRVQLISVLKLHDTFPLRTRNKIDELVEEFLTRTKDNIHDMLCNVNVYDDAGIDGDLYYRGLDSNVDTEAEVETALRVFPEVLSRRGGRYNMYPIQYLASGYKAVSLIPLLARLALEFCLFEEKERGGLLLEDEGDYNILQYLVHQDVDEHADETTLNVLIQLRQMGYFKKEDIQKYGLVVILCKYREISEIRFRFLVEWDPTSLIKTDGQTGCLPLHFAATYTIQNFRMVFEYGIRYYPKKKGISLLFQRSGFDPTPFLLACQISYSKHFRMSGRIRFAGNFPEEVTNPEDVMKVVEDILIRYSDTPINITEALITAAIDEDIHLNCVYFLLRREPDIVMQQKQTAAIVATVQADHEQIMSVLSCQQSTLAQKKDLLKLRAEAIAEEALARGRRVLEQRSAEEEDWIFFVKILGTNALAKLEEDPRKKLQMWNTFLAGRQERVNATEDRVIATEDRRIQREDQLSTQKLAANHAEHIRHMERERMGIEREVNSQKTAITHAFINSHGNVA